MGNRQDSGVRMNLTLTAPQQTNLTAAPPVTTSFLMVKACGICHSDRKAFYSPPGGMSFPRVLGHEIAGVLSQDLPEQNLSQEDRVILWPAVACGSCRFCTTERPNLCPDIQLFGYHLDGGFSTEIGIPSELFSKVFCYQIPDSVSFEQATFAEPLACIIHALALVHRRPESLLIFGGGVMGRLAGRYASSIWPTTRISLLDTNNKRLLNAQADGGADQLTPADCILIATSNDDAVYTALKNLNPGGTLLLFSGLSKDEKIITLDHNLLHQKEQTLVGSYGCCPKDMLQAVNVLAEQKITVDDLVSRVIPLSETGSELERQLTVDDYKTIIQL